MAPPHAGSGTRERTGTKPWIDRRRGVVGWLPCENTTPHLIAGQSGVSPRLRRRVAAGYSCRWLTRLSTGGSPVFIAACIAASVLLLHPNDTATTSADCTCASKQQTDGWCGKCRVGYLAGVKVES